MCFICRFSSGDLYHCVTQTVMVKKDNRVKVNKVFLQALLYFVLLILLTCTEFSILIFIELIKFLEIANSNILQSMLL